MNTRQSKREEGQILIMAMIFLLILTFLGFGLVTVATVDTFASRSQKFSEQVLDAAEQGVLMGMAWAGDASTGFKGLLPGQSISLTSRDRQPNRAAYQNFQYETVVTMREMAPPPEGWAVGKTDYVFMTVEVDSIGYVHTGPAIIPFDFARPPPVRRTLEVLARIMIQL